MFILWQLTQVQKGIILKNGEKNSFHNFNENVEYHSKFFYPHLSLSFSLWFRRFQWSHCKRSTTKTLLRLSVILSIPPHRMNKLTIVQAVTCYNHYVMKIGVFVKCFHSYFMPRNFMDAHLDNTAFTQIQDASVKVQYNWHFTSRWLGIVSLQRRMSAFSYCKNMPSLILSGSLRLFTKENLKQVNS